MAEWLMAPVLKTGVPERVPGVRIPPSPPFQVRLQRTPYPLRANQAECARILRYPSAFPVAREAKSPAIGLIPWSICHWGTTSVPAIFI